MTGAAKKLPPSFVPRPDPATEAANYLDAIPGPAIRGQQAVAALHLAVLWVDRAVAERAEAMEVLAPNIPEQGLVDACRQLKQAAILDAETAERLERKVYQLVAELRLLRG